MLDGGEGIDTASYHDSETSVGVDLKTGRGIVPVIDGSSTGSAESVGDVLVGIENVVGSRFADVLGGDDRRNTMEGRGGADRLLGCDGDDTLFGDADPLSRAPSDDPHEDDCGCDVYSDEHAGHGAEHGSSDDRLEGGCGNDTLHGGTGDDRLHGDEDHDRLFGDEGVDVLFAGIGNDYLSGGANSDLLYGEDGNDLLNGREGFDFLFGGAGVDTAWYRESQSGVNVDLAAFWLNSGGDASADLIDELLSQLVGAGTSSGNLFGSALLLPLLTSMGIDDPNASLERIPDITLGVENIEGSQFADKLSDDGGANDIKGWGGADILDGRGGADIMLGGGDDTYVVGEVGDKVHETAAAAGGADTGARTP